MDWGNSAAPPLLLIHGGRDHARNWDWVALPCAMPITSLPLICAGTGDSEWARWAVRHDRLCVDVQLLEQLQMFPITIIGHSLGGGLSVQRVYPERVKQLVAIEGLGPPPGHTRHGPAHMRMREWIAQMRAFAGRHARRYASLEEAVQRMQEANKHLTAAQAYHLTVHGIYRNEDGTYTWKFDNYVRSQSPYEFNVEEAHSFWQRITCPTLLLRGTESWATDPLLDGRASAFRNVRCVHVPVPVTGYITTNWKSSYESCERS